MTEIMTKNRETKSLLAKLMASENINVEYHEKASTAAFDTERSYIDNACLEGHDRKRY